MITDAELNLKKLYAALDCHRNRHQVSWRELGRSLDIDQALFSRLKEGKYPDAKSLFKFLLILETPLEWFVK